MSEFHLQARRFVGPLSAPERDETRLSYSDCWPTIRAEADALVGQGFTVWIFRAGRARRPPHSAAELRLVATFVPRTS